MRKTGQRRISAAVATAMTAIGVAGLSAFASPAMAAPVHGPRPFAQAFSKTVGQKSSDVSLVIDEKVAGQDIKITASGAFDYAHNLGSLKMNIGLGTGGESFQEIVAKGKAYLQLPPVEQAAFGGKPWLAVPIGSSTGLSGESPTSALELLQANATGVKKLGSAVVQGVATTEYQANIDPTKAMAKASPQVRKVLRQALSMFSGAHSLPIQVWIDGADRIRQMKETFNLTPTAGSALASTGQLSVVTTVVLSNYGVPVSVTVPPADQVSHQSLSSLGAAAGAGTSSTS